MTKSEDDINISNDATIILNKENVILKVKSGKIKHLKYEE